MPEAPPISDHAVTAPASEPALPTLPMAQRAERLVRRIAVAYAAATALLGALVAVPLRLPPRGPLVHVGSLAAEAVLGGLASLSFGAALVALIGSYACLLIAAPRRRLVAAPVPPAPVRRFVLWGPAAPGPAPMPLGVIARSVQGAVVPLVTFIAGIAIWRLRPDPGMDLPLPADANLLGGLAIILGFPALVAERAVAGLPSRAMPEAPALARLLRLPVLLLPLAGCLEIARGFGMAWTEWPVAALGLALIAIAGELGLRALARWFVPPPEPAQARAAVDSLLLALLLGAAAWRGLGEPVRSHFGLDFSRSWALSFLRAAAVPAVLLTALLCWGLSGVALIGLDQRGVYERFGAPVAVLAPGLHAVLPWPLGRVRRVELGIVHQVAVGGGLGAPAAMEAIDAEAPPPPSVDRLWDQAHPAEADYLVASVSDARQSFQTVSADIRVAWRVGLTDADASRAVYGAADPNTLVREAAGRLVARFFAARTLGDVLGAEREAMAERMRAQLARDLADADAGIEVVAVVIEAIHPPAGAAVAYHAVQAVEITANASISTEIGRARGTANLALEQSRHLTDAAQAMAAEITQGAAANLTRFTADQGAAQAGGQAFLLERYFAGLTRALSKAPLTIIDRRLADLSTPGGPPMPGGAPMIDLRPLAGAAARSTGVEDPD